MEQQSEKVAFITGANRGIGFETAKGLGALGIKVIIGARDNAKGEAAARRLQTLGYKAETIHYDANQAKSADAVFEYLNKHYGRLDILVNNAGINQEQLMGTNNSSTVSVDTLQQTFHSNLFAVIELTQKLLPLIKKHLLAVSLIYRAYWLHSH